MEKLSASQVTKLLREFEDIVLELDKAIESKEVSHEVFADLKARYDIAHDSIAHGAAHNDSRYYIIDEAAGLMAWVENEKTAAYHKIADAVAKKGDKLLTSHAGSALAAVNEHEAHGMKLKTEKYDSGWLGFLYVTVMLVMVGSVPMALILTVGSVMTIASGVNGDALAILPNAMLFCAVAVLSTYYVLRASYQLRRMRTVAIMLFSLLSLYTCYVILALDATTTEPTALYHVVFSILLLCGISTILYYVKASKVRRVFSN